MQYTPEDDVGAEMSVEMVGVGESLAARCWTLQNRYHSGLRIPAVAVACRLAYIPAGIRVEELKHYW